MNERTKESFVAAGMIPRKKFPWWLIITVVVIVAVSLFLYKIKLLNDKVDFLTAQNNMIGGYLSTAIQLGVLPPGRVLQDAINQEQATSTKR
jgi:uncharacterized membrane protein YhaH (DUF805 family)